MEVGSCESRRSSFWMRAIQTASKTSQRVFMSTFETYVDAVIQEAADRSKGHIRDIESYLEYRRHTAGSYPTFSLLYLDVDISLEVLEHPALKQLTLLAGDMIVILNVRPISFGLDGELTRK